MENQGKYGEIELKFKNKVFVQTHIKSSIQSYDVIKKFYHEDIELYESVFLLLLNNANKTICYAKISQGGVKETVVDVKIIGKFIVDSLATGCIVAHNHPSGNRTPSEEDKRLTMKINDVCRLLDCRLVDHLILSADGYYSFADEGIL